MKSVPNSSERPIIGLSTLKAASSIIGLAFFFTLFLTSCHTGYIESWRYKMVDSSKTTLTKLVCVFLMVNSIVCLSAYPYVPGITLPYPDFLKPSIHTLTFHNIHAFFSIVSCPVVFFLTLRFPYKYVIWFFLVLHFYASGFEIQYATC